MYQVAISATDNLLAIRHKYAAHVSCPGCKDFLPVRLERLAGKCWPDKGKSEQCNSVMKRGSNYPL